MTESRFSIDITPNHIVSGIVESDIARGPGSADVAERLSAHLAGARYIAAVDRPDGTDLDEAVGFTLACDAALQVLHADDTGGLAPGKRIHDVAAELSAALGASVSLWPDSDLLDKHVDDDADSDDDNEDDSDLGVYESEDEELLEGSDSDGDEKETPSRVLVFSHRGVSNGYALAWTTGPNLIEAGVEADWSVFRFLDQHGAVNVTAGTKKELPSIEVVFTDSESNGWAYVRVATPNARVHDAHVVLPTTAANARPVLDPESLQPQARQLLSVLVNDHLAHDSQANMLLADESIDIDAETFHAALAPDFAGETFDRIEALLVALRVPRDLAVAAVRESELPNARSYTRRPFVRHIWQISKDGMAGLSPLGGKKGVFRRIDDSLRARPLLAYGVSALELAAGLGFVVLGSFAGFWFTIVGAVLVIDAVIDIVLTTSRLRDRRTA